MDAPFKLLPPCAEELLQQVSDQQGLMSYSFKHLLSNAADCLYAKKFADCLEMCSPLLDKIWEELNTGYWKDVDMVWRYAYTTVSLLKALSQSMLLSEPMLNIDHMTILKTCDMGLLMGAPILNNALARISRDFQRAFGALAVQVQPGGEEVATTTIVKSKNQSNVNVSDEKLDLDNNLVDGKVNYNNTNSNGGSVVDDRIQDGLNSSNSHSNLDLVDQQQPVSIKKRKLSETENEKSSPHITTTTTTATEGIRDGDGGDNDKVVASNLNSTKNTTKTCSSCEALRQNPSLCNDISIPSKIVTQTTREIPRCSCPSVEMFSAMFMDNGHPVIISDAIGYWPALTNRKWSLEYLRRVAGNRTVPVELGKRYTDEAWTQKLMTVNEMIDNYITAEKSNGTTKAYLAQHQLFDQVWELRDDISVPVYCCLGEQEEVDINAWFGPAGTISPLHTDPKHNFLCQVMGRKYIRLYSSLHSSSMYPHLTKLLHNTSQIDLDDETTFNPEQFPEFSKLPCLEAILEPGDMLYIPPGHWHYVKSLDISFSVSFWWM